MFYYLYLCLEVMVNFNLFWLSKITTYLINRNYLLLLCYLTNERRFI
jgi:hypothetical protein